MHGPVLPKNPWSTDHLISRAPQRRKGQMGPSGSLAPLENHAEAEAHAAALRLVCRPGQRGAAAAVGSRRCLRGTGEPGRDSIAGRGAQPVGRGTGWNSR